jgi:hypothetical protein
MLSFWTASSRSTDMFAWMRQRLPVYQTQCQSIGAPTDYGTLWMNCKGLTWDIVQT